MKRVYFLYCLSGFITVGYLIVWLRLFDDQFGATNVTFGVVLCSMLGGFGTGALLTKRIRDCVAKIFRTGDRLRIYGLIELLVSATALLAMVAALIPANAWGAFPYVLDGDVYVSTTVRHWSRLGMTLACVFLPCLLIGTTYPLLCDAFRLSGDPSDTEPCDAPPAHNSNPQGQFPSALYAWKALGACVGVLACEFILLRTIGQDNAYWLLVAINVVIGLTFAFFGPALGSASGPAAATSLTPPSTIHPIAKQRSASTHGYLLTLAIVAGVSAGALGGDVLKRVWFLGGTSDAAMTFVSFWTALAIFMGACVVCCWKRMSWMPIKLACVMAAILYVVTWHFGHDIRRWLITADLATALDAQPSNGPGGAESMPFQTSLGQVFAFVGIFVFPAMFAFSLLLPMVCNQLHAAGKRVGVAFCLNMLATATGFIGFSLIAPHVNVFYSFKLFFVFLAVAVLLIVLLREGARSNSWLSLTAVIAFVAACFLTPRTFDTDDVMPNSPPTQFRVHELRSNGSHTTYAVAEPSGAQLYFDNHLISSTAPAAQTYMRLMAHFPLLAHDQPRTALLINFGVGNTASAIATHDSIERIDIAEPNRNVVKTAPFFSLANRSVHRDHRVRFIHDDGRSPLKVTNERYDLITCEAPSPMQAGGERFHTKQYFAAVRDRLTDKGMMTQRLPAYQLPRETVEHVVKTFTDAFPHTLLFTGYGREFVLLGSNAPLDLGNIKRRFEQSRTALLDLQAIGVRDALALLARIVQTDDELRKHFAAGRVLTDQRNDLHTLFANPLKPTVIRYNPRDVLTALNDDGLLSSERPIGERLDGVLMHLGRLRYHVPDFPRDTLATIPADANVTLADADWPKLDALRRAAARAQFAGKSTEMEAILLQSLAIEHQQPQVLLDLARLYFKNQQFESAIPPLEKLQSIEPTDPAGYHAMAETLIALKRFDAAAVQVEHCLRLQPNRADLHILHANILAELGHLTRAIAAYERALQLDEFSLEARTQRDALLQRLKNP